MPDVSPDPALAPLEYISEENYVSHAKRDRTMCPNCRSTSGMNADGAITQTDSEIDMAVNCSKCGCAWVEHYEITGYYGVSHSKENG